MRFTVHCAKCDTFVAHCDNEKDAAAVLIRHGIFRGHRCSIERVNETPFEGLL